MKYLARRILRRISLFLSVLISFALAVPGAVVAQEIATEALTTVTEGLTQGMTLILNLVSAAVFVIIAWAIITKFNDARRGRSDWGEVVVPFIAGAVVLAFVGWLNTNGQTAIDALGGGAG
jgi:integrating conjugative element membrane protein (TIGR03745 family)